jgi:afadin
MTKTGQRVQLKVAKQGAIFHGLATMLNQPSPVMQRSSPTGHSNMSPVPMKTRPKSEDVSRINGGNLPPHSPMEPGYGQKPLYMQHGARSSPALHGK